MAGKLRLTYVLYGSEDGAIGVFNVQKLAVAKAISYVENSGTQKISELERVNHITGLKKNGQRYVEGNGVSVNIEGFIMNR